MKLCLIAPALPPSLNGIGDYTAHLARELARSLDVYVLAAQGADHSPIPGAKLIPAFSPREPRTAWQIPQHVEAIRPDWIVLQYNPFSYGYCGFNPHLPAAISQIRRQCGRTRIAVMFHESFVPVTNWKFAVMTTWQRWQFRSLGRTADCLVFAIQPWLQRFRHWFPGKQLAHIGVGSNIPVSEITRSEARSRLGIGEDTVVLGFFATATPARLFELVKLAARAVAARGREVRVLYMGPNSSAVCRELEGVPVLAGQDGPFSAEDVSRRFAAVDVNLAPWIDGVSTRRTTLVTALQHGVATVGTKGYATDDLLHQEDGRALLLADVKDPDSFTASVLRVSEDPRLRDRLREGGRSLYDREFSWEMIGARWLEALNYSVPAQADPVALDAER
jgi:glycosyltransferase involved in cell wall biosynthesis